MLAATVNNIRSYPFLAISGRIYYLEETEISASWLHGVT